MFCKNRAVASENCRKLRLISAIKWIFKNKIIKLSEICGTSDIKQHFFFKRKTSISNLLQFLRHMKILEVSGKKVYVNYEDLKKKKIKFIIRLYEVIPW